MTIDDPNAAAQPGQYATGPVGGWAPGAPAPAPQAAPLPAPVAPDGSPAQYGVAGFTLRELIIVGVWLLTLIFSFFSLYGGDAAQYLGYTPIWGQQGLGWIPAMLLPTAAVVLFVLRRLAPGALPRVGSLGIDQFASVAFSIGALSWVSSVFSALFAGAIGSFSFVLWVEALLMLGLVFLTVFAPFVPGLRADFDGRPIQQAHRVAATPLPVIARPQAAPAPQQYGAPYGQPGYGQQPAYGQQPGYAQPAAAPVPQAAAPAAAPAPAAAQPFWALAPTERDVVDEQGAPLFRIGPSAWALVIEDRGSTFVIRHDDGRVGFLHEVGDLTRN